MRLTRKTSLAVILASAFLMSGCSDGNDGEQGAPGEPGAPGTPGADSTPAGAIIQTANIPTDLKFNITPKDVIIEPNKPFSVKFTVTGKNAKGDNVPFIGLEKIALYLTEQVANDSGSGSPFQWVNHGVAAEFGTSLYCTPNGATQDRKGNDVLACTLIEDQSNPGSYSLTWEHDGEAPLIWSGSDINNLHRLTIRSYNIVDEKGVALADKVITSPLDYIPATGELAQSQKDTVSNKACIACHGEKNGGIENIHVHHNYQRVENCVSCHNIQMNLPDSQNSITDANGVIKGFNPNFGPMIHRLHGDDEMEGPLTGIAKEKFGDIDFPARVGECSMCHDNGDSWNSNIYVDACQSCHIDVNFETGENHRGIVPQDDSVCAGCHGAGALSPNEAHFVGNRAQAEAAFRLSIADIDLSPDSGDLTVVFDLDAKLADGVSPADAVFVDAIKWGVIREDGHLVRSTVAAGSVFPIRDGIESNGNYTVIVPNQGHLADKSVFFVPYATVCTDGKDTLVNCDDNKLHVGDVLEAFYWNFASTDGSGYPTHYVDRDTFSIDEGKCYACHEDLNWVTTNMHGGKHMSSCAACHTPTTGFVGSYTSAVKAVGVDAEGNDVMVSVKPNQFFNRDLVTLVHRRHSGIPGTPILFGETGGIYRRVNDKGEIGELNGYPALLSNCNACHKDDVNIFTDNGTLGSGRESIAITKNPFVPSPIIEYISPVSESCRSCHVHNTDAAKAHFKANGANLNDNAAATSEEVNIESCAVCHGEGKVYGVDRVHKSPLH